MMAKYASKRAGIGLEIGRLRPLGSPIRGGEIMHTGMIPFLKKWFGDLRSCSQGGIRNASATVFYPIWHHQFDDLIVLKNNQGTEETRVRHMDYGVVLNAFFWRRFKNKEHITFFDPNEVPDLYEAFYKNTELFEELYEKYERKPGLRKKVISAEEVFKSGILKERTDTGRIYLVFIDNVMNQGPFDPEYHTVYQSNLCCEILLPTRPFKRLDDAEGRIALCTLGSINWGAFRNPEDMGRACRILQRSLCNILDYQDFLSIQSKLSNDEISPLGIGVTNLAYWHAKRSLQYGEAESLAEVKTWMEHQAYFLTEATVELAKERGRCIDSDKTWYGQGVFPWERRNKGVDSLTSFKPSKELDWEKLRKDMKDYGVRNATLMAIAPVESSSVVIDSTNGIEMPMSLITVKESKAGSFTQVAPEYQRLKNKYQLMWEQKDCQGYLKTAAVLAAYVDQSISTNTFYNPAHFEGNKVPTTLIATNLMQAHKWGIKTFYYSLINKAGSKGTDEEEPTVLEPIDFDDEGDCESCKL
jgi:ribonucleoside-diphosphate reductase alpha chain